MDDDESCSAHTMITNNTTTTKGSTSKLLHKQQTTSISEICKNETNLSLLTNTISSFLNHDTSRDHAKDLHTDSDVDGDVDEHSLQSNCGMDNGDKHRGIDDSVSEANL